MVYPKFDNKHLEEALFNPGDSGDNKHKGRVPRKIILFYLAKLPDYIKKKYHPKKIKINSILSIYQYKDIGFVYMDGIGSPHAVVVFEDLIKLGCNTFLNIGTAGGLHKTGAFLIEKALRDEGTSYHYEKHGDYSYSDKLLNNKFSRFLNKNKFDFQIGSAWTVDAIYRETKAEVEKYSKQGISVVDMECSALFTIAKYRKVKIASLLVVRDILSKTWINTKHKSIMDYVKDSIDLGTKFLLEMK